MTIEQAYGTCDDSTVSVPLVRALNTGIEIEPDCTCVGTRKAGECLMYGSTIAEVLPAAVKATAYTRDEPFPGIAESVYVFR